MTNKRSTASATAFRVDTVYGLLCEGQSRGDIVRFASEQWGVTDRQTDTYIARARDKLAQDADMARPAWLAEALGRLRKYEQQASKRGQLQVAINSVGMQAKLIGFEV